MSIAGGLFNANHKKDDIGDTKSTADGEAEGRAEQSVDLTTSLPGFDDDAEDGLLIDGSDFRDVEGDLVHGENEDVEGVGADRGADEFTFDVDAAEDIPLDPES